MEIALCKKFADAEIDNPTLEVSKQILAANKIQKDENGYCLDRYFLDERDKTIDFCYKIENEKYFLLISIDIKTKGIDWVALRNSNECYLTATSWDLSLQELAEITTLKHTSGWSKGDKISHGSVYSYSRINFKLVEKTSHELEVALSLLLDELEKDKNGIVELTKKSSAYIAIYKYQYISGNPGMSLKIETINRLSNLNLGFAVDVSIACEKCPSGV
ncbi:MAG: DUF4279 domain-containing protein [Spirochaetes bacterium]|nr:DUF4279 domain-containing protein [Spirochaetota bacterium]